MEQLLYTSTATARFAADDVFNIVMTSARNNPDREVTGFLVFADGAFLQLVEGPKERLDELLDVLSRDPRHRDITVNSRRSVQTRSFPNWRMQRIDTSSRDSRLAVAPLRAAGLPRDLVDQVEGFITRG